MAPRDDAGSIAHDHVASRPNLIGSPRRTNTKLKRVGGCSGIVAGTLLGWRGIISRQVPAHALPY